MADETELQDRIEQLERRLGEIAGDGAGAPRIEALERRLGEIAGDGAGAPPAAAPPNDEISGKPIREITTPASFVRDASGDQAVAGLLFYKELDCLIDLAHRVSLDFFDQPQLYRQVPDEIVDDLTALRTRYGSQEDFLSREQRQAIFAGAFGADVGAGLAPIGATTPAPYSFAALRDQLLAAAAAFAERVFSTSEDMLRAAVRVMHVYLQDYLQDTAGATVTWSRDKGLLKLTDLCYRILRDADIAARFSVNQAARVDWPFVADANGSKLVEQISSTPIQGMAEPISRGEFNDKQQLALRGAEALATVIDFDANDTNVPRTDLLITKCYTWYAARGRVLHLPVAGAAPPSVAPAAAPAATAPALMPPALTPATTLAPMDGNRSLYGPAASTASVATP